MEAETFVASRWTRGNFLFPTRIVVSDQSVMRRKRSWLTLNDESIHIRNVASVDITTGLIWSTLRIDSSGGADAITSHGHTKGDARRIKQLIEMLQAALGHSGGDTDTGPAGDTKTCPYCAETIKKAAILCRYCNRELA